MDSLLSIVQMPAGVPGRHRRDRRGPQRRAARRTHPGQRRRRPPAADGGLPGRAADRRPPTRAPSSAAPRAAPGSSASDRPPRRRDASSRSTWRAAWRCSGWSPRTSSSTRDPDGSLTFGQALAGGRASALFAVLAGVSIALVTGRRPSARRRLPGPARPRGSASGRVLVAALGLLLGAGRLGDRGDPHLLRRAVRARPAVRRAVRPAALALLAAGWLVVAPVLSHLVRPSLPERQYASPTWGQLVADPGGLARRARRSPATTRPCRGWPTCSPGWPSGASTSPPVVRRRLLAAGGAAAAVGATAVSRVLTARPSVQRGPARRPAGAGRRRAPPCSTGSRPACPAPRRPDGAWQWLLVVAPHTATPFDLLQTIGSALLVIGARAAGPVRRGSRTGAGGGALLRGRRDDAHPLLGARAWRGRSDFLPDTLRDSYLFHVLLLLGIGSVFAATRTRGPLEGLVGAASRAAAGRPHP